MSNGFALQASVVLVVFRAALAQLEVRPDVSGEWEITYAFSEVRGDRGNFVAPPPCKGPFPYYHTFTVEIDPMEEGSNTFKYCYRGTDCTLYKFETTMQQGTADVVDSKCILRPYRGFSDFGLVPFADAPLVTDSSISLQSDRPASATRSVRNAKNVSQYESQFLSAFVTIGINGLRALMPMQQSNRPESISVF